MTAPSSPIATTPSSGTLNGGDPAGSVPGDEEGLGDPLGFREEGAVSEPVGDPLGLLTVVPNGVGAGPGETELPGRGVAVAGTGVGLAVGTGVGTGVGGGVGAVTITGAVGGRVGLVPPLLIALNVTGQLPTGKLEEPVQVPFAVVPPVRTRECATPATVAVTLLAVSEPLWKRTEN